MTEKKRPGYSYYESGWKINPVPKTKIQVLRTDADKAKKKVFDLIDERNMREEEDPLF